MSEQQQEPQAKHRGALVVLQPVEHAAGGMLRWLLDSAIDGVQGLPGARKSAARYLTKHGEHEAAINVIIRHHVMMAGAQGFVTNLGGLATLPFTMPANITGVAIVQLRMVATIAHLRGYDLDDPRVRSAILLCLLGDNPVTDKLTKENLPSSPLIVATAPVFDAELDRRISERVMAELAANVTGRRAASLIGRRIPFVGGGVGASLDSWSTYQLGRWVKEQLVARRVRI